MKTKSGGWEWVANYGKIIPTNGEWGECFTGVSVNVNNQRLNDSKRKNAEKMGLMRELVGGVAHNFNNILATMTGRLYLAKHHSSSSEANRNIECIEDSCHEAASMVKQLLSFIHYSTDKKEDVLIVPLLREAVEIAQLSVSKKNTFITNYADDTLLVHCNPEEIKEALIHLILNARDALENSLKKEIYVTFEQRESEKSNLILLIVKDTGCGISKEHIERVYDPFFSTKEVGKGKGLGLSMTKGVVESHGGKISITSTIGLGTQVSICLPLV